LGTTDPIARFFIGFKSHDVFNYRAGAKGLNLPITTSGVLQYKNNA
jgi:hypothetical protein